MSATQSTIFRYLRVPNDKVPQAVYLTNQPTLNANPNFALPSVDRFRLQAVPTHELQSPQQKNRALNKKKVVFLKTLKDLLPSRFREINHIY
jgi:hypothetical protein